jgi:hypothetical protein
MEKGNKKETEDFLGAFSLKAGPTRLKEKILEGILQKQKPNRWMTVFLRKGFMGCLLILIFVIAVDAIILGVQNKRISSLLDNRQESTGKSEEEWSLLKDIIGEPFDSKKNAVGKMLFGFPEKSGTRRQLWEWRESLEKEIEQDEIAKDFQ